MSSPTKRQKRQLSSQMDDDFDDDSDRSDQEDDVSNKRQPARSTTNDDDDNDDDDDDQNDTRKQERRERLRKEIETMHRELEVTGYARTKTGQRVRKVPRHISKLRTQKRKVLERADANEFAILRDDDDHDDEEESDDDVPDCDVDERDLGNNDGVNDTAGGAMNSRKRRKRLRGSLAAIDKEVIEGSMIFSPERAEPVVETTTTTAGKEIEQDAEENENKALDDDNEDGADMDDDDEDEDAGDDVVEDENDGTVSRKSPRKTSSSSSSSRKTKSKPASRLSAKKRRQMYRLRNFQSFRMAQKHGDALAFHARGMHKLAIEKLKEVARDAPSAPQVYSSLGLVYRDMLNESRERYRDNRVQIGAHGDQHNDTESNEERESQEEKSDVQDSEESHKQPLKEDSIPDPFLAEQCDLAKKAYGSYHIAAILCKQDFTLWVQAGDSALATAEVHEDIVRLPNLSRTLSEYHKTEKRRWQDESLRDITMADNLKPPGIDVPAKLASIHLELGNLSEALTILTDLKNRAGDEFHGSYKAWMLYSDLMLRIGHECIQWNKGVLSNENYMFRRWLRRYSRIFDWQERRLQALTLALEAAAGSNSTADLLDWVRKRSLESSKETGRRTRQSSDKVDLLSASHQSEDDRKTSKKLGEEEEDDGEADRLDDEEEHVTKPDASQLEEERSILVKKQSRELKQFDKTTADMSLLPSSTPAKDREVAREKLVQSHETAMSTLEKEYSGKEKKSSNVAQDTEKIVATNDKNAFPISGSVRQVCYIASNLMRQLHGLDLFEGSRLVGDAVSKYMKERARRADSTIAAKQRADEWQQKLLNSPLMLDSYDEVNGNSDDNEEVVYLSDEEHMLQEGGNSVLLNSLRRGVLTPELKVFYGTALIAKGGRDFLAAKCLEEIEHLELESGICLSSDDQEAQYASDPFWFVFHRAMTENVSRTSAYAFLADVLKKTEKEAEWAGHFCPLFRRHVETLKNIGLFDELLSLNSETISLNGSIQKNQILNVITATCKFAINSVEQVAGVRSALANRREKLNDPARIEIASFALETAIQVLSSIWGVNKDGNIPYFCSEICAKCIRWFSIEMIRELTYSNLKKILEKCTTLVSLLCGNSIPDLGGVEDSEMKGLLEAKEFPVNSLWQPSEYQGLSTRAYNLAIACSVSVYSGWEKEEFHIRSLSRKVAQKDSGVKIRGKRVAGCLPGNVEEELKRQWAHFEKLEPRAPKLDFSEKLKEVKNSEWFENEMARRRTTGHNEMPKNAEHEALVLLLGYSALCLHLAGAEVDKRISNRHHQLALSVLIPISQFCLDEILWGSHIVGEIPKPAANPEAVRYREWPAVARYEETRAMIARYEEIRARAAAARFEELRSRAAVPRPRHEEWRTEPAEADFYPINDNMQDASQDTVHPVFQTNKAPRKKELKRIKDTRNFITIPCKYLSRSWREATSSQISESIQVDEAKQQMQSIHTEVEDLRSSYTVAAAEKVCLSLALALLEMASTPGCFDPFSCLHQAAVYASHAPKAGNNDTSFRRPLPDIAECKPLEAVVVLGRADCLHAIYFPSEAKYLCSYVARVCRLHRDPDEPQYKWNDQWKIVSMYAYNVSAMICSSVPMIPNHVMQKGFKVEWDCEISQELENGRKDGEVYVKIMTHHSDTSKAVELNTENDTEHSVEDINGEKTDKISDSDENGDIVLENDPGFEVEPDKVDVRTKLVSEAQVGDDDMEDEDDEDTILI